ncbi:hypothetical protein ICL16_06415 [Iningainema sp. BLCCT55]|uniref:Uncharacterized protein n=1 Tax=Iningainema tapete BLCC-T55 TaxID=2748662 RepID=A0A8J6XH73_9CYAN|nr:hypothetical protein [Iningainema tapete]MBD2771739.1 hypothetical protein [Iningainema tapete BLCC-T55]
MQTRWARIKVCSKVEWLAIASTNDFDAATFNLRDYPSLGGQCNCW